MDRDLINHMFISGFSDELEKIAFASSPSPLARQSSMMGNTSGISPLGSNLRSASKPPPRATPIGGSINKTTASGAIINPGNSQSISANAIGPKNTNSIQKDFSPPSIG